MGVGHPLVKISPNRYTHTPNSTINHTTQNIPYNKELVEKFIPVEEPSEEERKAIEEKDEIAEEKELIKALGKTNVQH